MRGNQIGGAIYHTKTVDGYKCYIGYGIDILNADYPNTDKLVTNWLNPQAFGVSDSEDFRLIEGIGDYENRPSVTVKATFTTGESVSEMLQSTEIRAKVETGKAVPFFSGGIETKFGKSNEQKHTSRYAITNISIDCYKFIIHGHYKNNPEKLQQKKFMDADFLADVNNPEKPIRELFDSYGTHMIVAHTVGARADINYTYNGSRNITKHDFEVSIKASTAYVSAGTNTKISDSVQSVISACRLDVFAWGGEATHLVHSDIAKVHAGVDSWKNSVTQNNSILNNIQELIPIWYFASGDRRKNIEDDFYKNADKRLEYLKNYKNKSGDSIITSGKKYTFSNLSSELYMDVKGGSRKKSTPIIIHYRTGANQCFTAYEAKGSPGFFFFKAECSGLVWDIRGGNYEGGELIQHEQHLYDNQLFKPKANEDGTISLFCKRNDKYVLTASGNANASAVVSRKWDKNNNQKWLVSEV